MIIILTFIAFTGLVALISWYKDQGGEPVPPRKATSLQGVADPVSVIAGFTGNDQPVHRTAGRTGTDKSYSTNMGAMSWSGKRKHRAAGAGTDLPAEVTESRHHHHSGISGGSI